MTNLGDIVSLFQGKRVQHFHFIWSCVVCLNFHRATSARRRIQNKSYSSPPIAPKIHKNLRTSATLAALFGEDGVFGERPRAVTIGGPMSSVASSASSSSSNFGSFSPGSSPPGLMVTLSDSSRRLVPSASTSSINNDRISVESVNSSASLGTYEVGDSSLGSSAGSIGRSKSIGSSESTSSFDLGSPASVDSSRMLKDTTRVSLLSSRSYGGSMGSLTVGRRHVSHSGSSKSNLEVGKNLKNGNNNSPRVHIVEETTIIIPAGYYDNDNNNNNNNSTWEEPTDTTITDEMDTSLDDPEIVIVSPPYQSPKRKARTISDAATKMNHSPSRLMARSTSNAIAYRNRAFSDADVQSAVDSETESESEVDDTEDSSKNSQTEDVDRLVVARQRAFSDADMSEPSMLIHSDQSYNSLGGSSTNVSRVGMNGSSGSLSRGRILASGSVGRSGSTGSRGEAGDIDFDGYSSMKSSMDSVFGDIASMVCYYLFYYVLQILQVYFRNTILTSQSHNLELFWLVIRGTMVLERELGNGQKALVLIFFVFSTLSF